MENTNDKYTRYVIIVLGIAVVIYLIRSMFTENFDNPNSHYIRQFGEKDVITDHLQRPVSKDAMLSEELASEEQVQEPQPNLQPEANNSTESSPAESPQAEAEHQEEQDNGINGRPCWPTRHHDHGTPGAVPRQVHYKPGQLKYPSHPGYPYYNAYDSYNR